MLTPTMQLSSNAPPPPAGGRGRRRHRPRPPRERKAGRVPSGPDSAPTNQPRNAPTGHAAPRERQARPGHATILMMKGPRLGKNSRGALLRKEVIQPHLPVRLPCYDFVPIADPTFDGSLPERVGPPASGVTDFHDVTGGVYKARERIHRSVADLRLLATPTSRGRVADPDPN
jgi:hypothetical protein